MCVPGAALEEELISDFGRLCAEVLPSGGDIVRGQTDLGEPTNGEYVHSPRTQTQVVLCGRDGHCSEGIDSLGPRLNLEGKERLI